MSTMPSMEQSSGPAFGSFESGTSPATNTDGLERHRQLSGHHHHRHHKHHHHAHHQQAPESEHAQIPAHLNADNHSSRAALKAHHAAKASADNNQPGAFARVEQSVMGSLAEIKSAVIQGATIKRGDGGIPIVEHVHGKKIVAQKPAHQYGGHCAIAVESALNKAGIRVNIANADHIAPELKQVGFQALKVDKHYAPIAGDVMVIKPVGEHKVGHVAIYTGKKPEGCGWVSDAVQGDEKFPMKGVPEHTQAAATTYFRKPELAAQATQLQKNKLADNGASKSGQIPAANSHQSGIAMAPGMSMAPSPFGIG